MASAEDRIISYEQRTLIEHLRRERLSLRGLCRAVGGSLTWLLHVMVKCFAACPAHVHVQLPGSPTEVVIRRLEAEADELWSCVGKQANQPWRWSAMDAKTRQVSAFHVGDRCRETAKELWAKMPWVYREQARFPTDPYDADQGVSPPAQHKARTKNARTTNHVERLNNTWRPRVSRLVREPLSCSKKLANQIGAIKYFICHYHLTKATALPV